MPSFMTVCPFCLSMFPSEYFDGDDCPECNVGILMTYDEYSLRLSVSFMNALEEERGNDYNDKEH